MREMRKRNETLRRFRNGKRKSKLKESLRASMEERRTLTQNSEELV